MPDRSVFEAVLFDLDGTLVDTAPDIADALNAALADLDLRSVEEAWVRNRIGNGTRSLLRSAVLGDALLEPALLRFHHHYSACCGRRGRLYPGAAVTLTSLHNAGVKLGLITNKEKAFADFVLEVHGISTSFDVLVYGDSLPVKKPEARVIRHALEQLRVHRTSALMIGDSAVDVECARNAGVEVWAVDYGYNHGDPISDAHPDEVIGRLDELLALTWPEISNRLAQLPLTSRRP